MVDHPDRHRHSEVPDLVGSDGPPPRGPLPPLEHLRLGVFGAHRFCSESLRVISLNAPSSSVLSDSWKIVIRASEAAGRSRSIASSISGQRSAGMSALANGFHTSVMNSFTNERDTDSQCRLISAITDSAAPSGIPLLTASSATARSDGFGASYLSPPTGISTP